MCSARDLFFGCAECEIDVLCRETTPRWFSQENIVLNTAEDSNRGVYKYKTRVTSTSLLQQLVSSYQSSLSHSHGFEGESQRE